MQGTFDVVVVGQGVYGPFPDETSPDDRAKDRSYSWVSIQGQDGEGEPVKATFAPGLDWAPVLFKPLRCVVELRDKGKLRIHGEALKAAA